MKRASRTRSGPLTTRVVQEGKQAERVHNTGSKDNLPGVLLMAGVALFIIVLLGRLS